jgi:hypothetical protein
MNATKKALVLLALLAAAGCQRENASSVVIRGRAMPDVDDTGCFWNDDGEYYAGDARLDVSADPVTGYSDQLRYKIGVYLRNDMDVPDVPASLAGKDFRADAARVRLNPPDFVDANDPNPLLLPISAENTVPLQGLVVEAGGGTRAQVIQHAVGHELGLEIQTAAAGIPLGESRNIVLGITIQGHTLDGEYLETNEWPYGVRVCNGCLPRLTNADCGVGFVVSRVSCYPPGQDDPFVCVPAN